MARISLSTKDIYKTIQTLHSEVLIEEVDAFFRFNYS